MKKHLSRRDFIKVAGLASGAGILAACQPAATPTQAPAAVKATEAPAAAPASETVTITFTGWGGTEEDQGVKDAIKYFEVPDPQHQSYLDPDPGKLSRENDGHGCRRNPSGYSLCG